MSKLIVPLIYISHNRPIWIFTFSAKEKDSEIGYSVTSLRSANAKRVWLGIRSFVGLVQGITAAI